MSKKQKEPECVVLDDDSSGEEEGYIRILFQNNAPYLDIPLEDDGSLSWAHVQIMDDDKTIIGLSARRDGCIKVVKKSNGFFIEPKEGWKAFKIYALLKPTADDRSNASSRLDCSNASSRLENLSPCPQRNVKVEATKRKAPLSSLTNQSVTSSRSRVSSINSSMNLAESKDRSNASSLLDNASPPQQPHGNVKVEASRKPAPLVTQATQNKTSSKNTSNAVESKNMVLSTPIVDHSSNKSQRRKEVPTSSQSQISSTTTAASVRTGTVRSSTVASATRQSLTSRRSREPTDKKVFAAFDVKTIWDLQYLLYKRDAIFHATFASVFKHYKRTLIDYPDIVNIQLLHFAKKSMVLYQQIDSSASKFCHLCTKKPLTIAHVLSGGHAKKYQAKYNLDPPQMIHILHPKNQPVYYNVEAVNIAYNAQMLKELSEFSSNKFSDKSLFEKYKDAFVYRISNENLVISVQDEFFLDRFLFMQKNLNRKLFVDFLKFENKNCLKCEKKFLTDFDMMEHIMSVRHIKYALSQQEFDLFGRILSLTQKMDTGYKFLVKPEVVKRKKSVADGAQEGEKHSQEDEKHLKIE